jgi:hypothetical protein
MACSNEENRLVLATGNKSELSVGYCTLYGDTVGGLAVLGSEQAGGDPAGRPSPENHDALVDIRTRAHKYCFPVLQAVMYTTSSVMLGTACGSYRGRPLDAQSTDAVCDNVATMVAAAGREPAG